MTHPEAPSWEKVVGYFAGDLAPPEETELEDHWAECEACAHQAAGLATLVRGIGDMVGRGWGLWAISPEMLQRFRASGLSIREADATDGGALMLEGTHGVDLLIGHLRGDFSGLREVQVEFASEVGLPDIVERQVPVFSPDEIIIACVLHLRVPPGTRIRTECRVRADGRVVQTCGLGIDVSAAGRG